MVKLEGSCFKILLDLEVLMMGAFKMNLCLCSWESLTMKGSRGLVVEWILRSSPRILS